MPRENSSNVQKRGRTNFSYIHWVMVDFGEMFFFGFFFCKMEKVCMPRENSSNVQKRWRSNFSYIHWVMVDFGEFFFLFARWKKFACHEKTAKCTKSEGAQIPVVVIGW